MAEEYRGSIIKALKEFDTSHEYSESDYKALICIGLKGTAAWKEKKRKGEDGDIDETIQELLHEESCM